MTIDSRDLHVIAVYFNPLNYVSRYKTANKFIMHMFECGVSLTFVECVLQGNTPVFNNIDCNIDFNYIKVECSTILWNKENLINIGISKLPANWKYMAWIDADIEFLNKFWSIWAIRHLQKYAVIQPWSIARDLGPSKEVVSVQNSFMYQYCSGNQVVERTSRWWKFDGGPYTFAHSGYAWAATRDAIEKLDGLYEYGILGSSDHHMARALIGEVTGSVIDKDLFTLPKYLESLLSWQQRAKSLNGNFGYLHGAIEHSYHGHKSNRFYRNRRNILIEHAFDPYKDLIKNSYGVIELIGKPKLSADILEYFIRRREDD